MRPTRFDDRLRQLEARVLARAEARKFADIDLSTDHGRCVARIFRHSQDRRHPMTLAEAERLATRIEEFVAAVDCLDGYVDDEEPVYETP